MRAATTKKLPIFALGISYLLSCLLFSAGVAQAANPYFQVTGGDIFTGGQYESFSAPSTFSCDTSSANYQAPNFSDFSTTKTAGGILAYATYNGSTTAGAKGDFGVMALGLIEGSSSGYGFGSNGETGKNTLTFSNSNNNGLSSDEFWGGFSEGTVHQQNNCIKDYYNSKQVSPGAWGGNLTAAGSGQYIDGTASGVAFELNAGTIDSGESITLFVNRDVYIKGNITYGAHNANNVPKFALIVNGNIFVDPAAVTQLNGLYVAQPTNATNGVIWTCATPSVNGPTAATAFTTCQNKKLTFNGAVIARQVNLTRLNGDVGGDFAESFNYIPEMVIGGPFFNPPSSTELKVESLISLPPVF